MNCFISPGEFNFYLCAKNKRGKYQVYKTSLWAVSSVKYGHVSLPLQVVHEREFDTEEEADMVLNLFANINAFLPIDENSPEYITLSKKINKSV